MTSILFIKLYFSISFCASIFFVVAAKNSFIDPNNLFSVFDESGEDTLTNTRNDDHDGLPVTSSKCNYNLTRALAAKVLQSMAKYRPGDSVRTSVIFYLSWEDAAAVSEFLDKSSLAEFATQSFIDKIESATLDSQESFCQHAPPLLSDHFNYQIVPIVVVGISVAFMITRLMRVMTIRLIACITIGLAFIGSFVVRYIYLYQLEVAKMETKMHRMGHQIPSHCRREVGFTEFLKDPIKYYFQSDQTDCEEFFKSYHIDARVKISPLQVLGDTFLEVTTPLFDRIVGFTSQFSSTVCKNSWLPGCLLIVNFALPGIMLTCLIGLLGRTVQFSMFNIFKFKFLGCRDTQSVNFQQPAPTPCLQAFPPLQQFQPQPPVVVNVNAPYPLMHSYSSPEFYRSSEKMNNKTRFNRQFTQYVDRLKLKRLKQLKIKNS